MSPSAVADCVLLLDLDLAVVQRAGAQALAQLHARRRRGPATTAPVTSARSKPKRIEVGVARRGSVASSASSTRSSAAPRALPCTSLRDRSRDHPDGGLEQVAHDRLDVAADVADLGVLRGLDLRERRADQGRRCGGRSPSCRRPSGRSGGCSRGITSSRSSVAQLQAAPAVADRHGDGALGLRLADDVAVERLDDARRGQVLRRVRPCRSCLSSRGS